MAQTVSVTVIQKNNGVFVYPPGVSLRDGDTFRLVNTTPFELNFHIGDTRPFNGAQSKSIPPAKSGKPLPGMSLRVPKPDQRRDGKYDYVVEVITPSGTYRAEAASDPWIIIDNP
jgi:hypothetical protein